MFRNDSKCEVVRSWIALDIKTQSAGKRYKFYFVSVASIVSIDKIADIGIDVIV